MEQDLYNLMDAQRKVRQAVAREYETVALCTGCGKVIKSNEDFVIQQSLWRDHVSYLHNECVGDDNPLWEKR